MVVNLAPHSVLLFQGNSITDAGRSRRAMGPNSPSGLGNGYPRLISDQLLKSYPDHALQLYNRGVSGDRLQDLSLRWEKDTLRLVPDLISILIGVNDTWNYLFLGMGASPGEFRKRYRSLLQDTRQHLPDTSLVLCEPFILLTGEVTGEWEEDLFLRRQAVAELAREFQAALVPFQTALDRAVEGGTPPHQLLEDGVHPTHSGHELLAECWIRTVLG